ncbi:hypothetical protein FXO37_06422 [Capsicum annuum]|nr:hypothetical protein FXO37_06422 [Capsicum annuum]
MEEIWINYYGMSVYSGLKEFAIVTSLRCYFPEEPLTKETPRKSSKARRIAKPPLSNSGKKLSQRPPTKIRPPTKTNKCKEKIDGLLDIADMDEKPIKDDLLRLAEDFEKFNDYPWGYDSCYLTFKYLLTKLSPKMITLHGFPWAFIVRAFKAIPHLQNQVKDYLEEVSHLGILVVGYVPSVPTNGLSIATDYPSTATGAIDG